MGCVEPAPFSGGEVSFLQYFNLHRKSAKLRELAMSPRFSFWATRLLGVSKVRLVLRIFVGLRLEFLVVENCPQLEMPFFSEAEGLYQDALFMKRPGSLYAR